MAAKSQSKSFQSEQAKKLDTYHKSKGTGKYAKTTSTSKSTPKSTSKPEKDIARIVPVSKKKVNAPTSGAAPAGKSTAKTYMISTPGVVGENYTVTSSGKVLNAKGQAVSKVDRDRLGRTAGFVEYENLDAQGNVTGRFIAPNVGVTTGANVRKVGDKASAAVSTSPLQQGGHIVLPSKSERLKGETEEAFTSRVAGGFSLQETVNGMLESGWKRDLVGNFYNPETREHLTHQQLRQKLETEAQLQAYGKVISTPEVAAQKIKEIAPTEATQPIMPADRTEGFNALKTYLGKFGESTIEAIQRHEETTGRMFDTYNERALVDLKKAIFEGKDIQPVLDKYSVEEGELTQPMKKPTGEGLKFGEDITKKAGKFGRMPEKPTPAFKGAEMNEYSTDLPTGFIPEAIEDPKERYSKSLENTNKGDFGTLMNQMLTMDWDNMTSADALKANLLATLKASEIEDEGMDNFINNAAFEAKKTYDSTLESIQLSREEIGKAVSGEEFVPQTYEGLQAQIMKGTEKLQIESIEEEKKYQKEQMDLWKKDTTAKRNRLEGYLKAQLVAMGASDSTAGLSLMAMQVNQADLRIQMQESEYNHGLAQLDLQGREIMTNFTNSVLELNMQTKTSEDEAQAILNTKLDELTKERFLNKREKNKVQMQALSDFNTELLELKKQQKDEEWKLMEFNYKKLQDAQENAYKLSGMMGTYFTLDGEGNIVDTGIETWDVRQFRENYAMEKMQYDRLIANDSFNQARDLLNIYGSNAAASVEQILGMKPGTLTGLETIEEQKLAIQKYEAGLTYNANLYSDTNIYNGATDGASPIAGMYEQDYYEDGLECGFFVRDKFFNLPSMGDSLKSKIKNMDNVLKGQRAGATAETTPRVGDMLIMDVGTPWGHVAIVNKVNADGTVTLTESNYAEKWTVDNTRTISINDEKIKAIHRGDLKPEIAAQLNEWNTARDMGQFNPGAMTSSEALQMKAYENSDGTKYPPDVKTLAQKKAFDLKYNQYKEYLIDKNTPLQDIIKFSTGGKPLTQSEIESIENFQSTSKQLEDLENIIMDADTGPIIGTLKSWNPYSTEAAQVKAQIQSMISGLARGIYKEVGVLTDADINRYVQTLPNMQSTQEQKELLLDMTKKMLQRGIEDKMRVYAGSGTDVSGLATLVQGLLYEEEAIAEQDNYVDSYGEYHIPKANESVMDYSLSADMLF